MKTSRDRLEVVTSLDSVITGGDSIPKNNQYSQVVHAMH